MKFIIYIFLLFSFITSAQTDNNISVISLQRPLEVYRHVPNRIKIAVPGAKAFTVTAPDLEKIDSLGNYILTPTSAFKGSISINALMYDNTSLQEVIKFDIKELPALRGALNGDICDFCVYEMSRNDLIKSQVDVVADEVILFKPNDKFFGVKSFVIRLPRKINNLKAIYVEGNRMNDEAIIIINKLKDEDILIISDIRFWHKMGVDFMSKQPSPIKVILYD